MDSKILKAKATKNKKSLFGMIANGGTFNVENIQIEIIANKSDFITVQVYEYGKGCTPEKQNWIRTKKVIVKEKVVEQKKKPEPEKFNVVKEVKKKPLW